MSQLQSLILFFLQIIRSLREKLGSAGCSNIPTSVRLPLIIAEVLIFLRTNIIKLKQANEAKMISFRNHSVVLWLRFLLQCVSMTASQRKDSTTSSLTCECPPCFPLSSSFSPSSTPSSREAVSPTLRNLPLHAAHTHIHPHSPALQPVSMATQSEWILQPGFPCNEDIPSCVCVCICVQVLISSLSFSGSQGESFLRTLWLESITVRQTPGKYHVLRVCGSSLAFSGCDSYPSWIANRVEDVVQTDGNVHMQSEGHTPTLQPPGETWFKPTVEEAVLRHKSAAGFNPGICAVVKNNIYKCCIK